MTYFMVETLDFNRKDLCSNIFCGSDDLVLIERICVVTYFVEVTL